MKIVKLFAPVLFAFAAIPMFAQKKPADPPPEPTVVSVAVKVPSLSPAQETKPTQTKGGIRITIDTDTFAAEAVPAYTLKAFQPGFKEIFKIACSGSGTMNSFYIKTYEPKITTKPDHLILHLHIDNQMPRVFRGSGALVQFTIAGKTIHISPDGYGEFINAIIPPRTSQDFNIIGPEIALIPAHATVGVNIFDVITKMDPAGNIQEKQDFEWYYAYETQTENKDVTLPPPTKVCIRQ